MRRLGFVPRFFRNWRAADAARLRLDELLAHADATADLVVRNEWLVELGYWLRQRGALSDQGDSSDETAVTLADKGAREFVARVRYVLNVLERNLLFREQFVATLRSIFIDLDGVALLCDTGLAQHPSFWSEFRERVIERLIPPTPNTRDWDALLTLLFPDEVAATGIAALDDPTWSRCLALFQVGNASSPTAIGRDLAASIRFLVVQIRAAALATPLRSRMDFTDISRSPFLPLEEAAAALLSDGSRLDVADMQTVQRLNLFHAMLEQCHGATQQVFVHLEEHGVSVEIVFQVERIRKHIRRIESLVGIAAQPDVPGLSRSLFVELVQSNLARRSVFALAGQSFSRLARKVVDRSAQTGEHYIARTREEYQGMVRAAAGGGLLTALTVYGKFAITGLHLHRLFEGLLASLNYAGSFVALQFLGLTLATKQPAMTAPALAAKLDQVGRPGGMDAFVDETLALVRSQAAAVFGNVALVIPAALSVQWLFRGLFHADTISVAKAEATIASFSLFGLTPLYAALTGVLLFASSLVAGWADNWFVYRRIADVMAYHRRIRFVLGEAGALRLASFWRHHVSAFAGNVSLGLLLGMTPVIGEFFALALEVRHVTLSCGNIAVAVGVLGSSVLATTGFWSAVAGIASMAVLNVGVSFFLAFQVALRSRSLPGVRRKEIYRAILAAVRARPLSLVKVAPPRAELIRNKS